VIKRVIKRTVVFTEANMYKILFNILLSRFYMQCKLLGVISVDVDATGTLLIIYSAFIKYLRKKGIQ